MKYALLQSDRMFLYFMIYSAATSGCGWAGWAIAHPEFGSSVTLLQPGGQIMPYELLLAHPDLKTHRHL